MSEIITICPRCKELDKTIELELKSWSPLDLGTAYCPDCGFEIDYNEERRKEELIKTGEQK
jgi:Zn ribbon nucleic-acid-binding protein